MSIPITCPACGKKSQVKEKYAGRTGGCPHCRAKLNIPVQRLDTEWLDGVENDPPPHQDRQGPNSSNSSVSLSDLTQCADDTIQWPGSDEDE